MRKVRLNRKIVNPSIPIYTGEVSEQTIGMQLFRYNKDKCSEDKAYTLTKFKGITSDEYQYWLNVDGIHNPEFIKTICKKINIHDLAIQDILDIGQRTKFQDYENYWFFSIKSIVPSADTQLEQEQLSFVLGPNFLLSFQERKADYFEHIRERLRKDMGIIRSRTADYLLYLLLEAILDNYFKTVDSIEDRMEKLRMLDLESDPSPKIIKTIELYKRELNIIKKTISAIRDFVAKIERDHSGFIKEEHLKYYFELKDLCFTLIDDCDTLSARLESSINLFFSIQGSRMNQVMKTLTVVSTIFIPLTFVAGVYGMNFANMPELSWKWGYASVWALMIIILIGMIIYFKRKKWY